MGVCRCATASRSGPSDRALLDAARDGGPQRCRFVILQETKALLDIEGPASGPTMDELGQPALGGGAELPEALPLVVETTTVMDCPRR
jgi:hypothetical protein